MFLLFSKNEDLFFTKKDPAVDVLKEISRTCSFTFKSSDLEQLCENCVLEI